MTNHLPDDLYTSNNSVAKADLRTSSLKEKDCLKGSFQKP